MRILAIGDMHGKIPEGIPKDVDLILLTGDFGKADIMRKQAFRKVDNQSYEPTNIQVKQGYMQAYNTTLDVLKRLRRIAPIYLTYGNVESSDSDTKKISKKIGLKLPFIGKAIERLDISRIDRKVKMGDLEEQCKTSNCIDINKYMKYRKILLN